MECCGVIVSRQEDIVGHRDDGYLAECILPYNHEGSHVVQTPEGECFSWKDDWECDCCDADEDERCYVYGPIEESEVRKLLKKGSSL